MISIPFSLQNPLNRAGSALSTSIGVFNTNKISNSANEFRLHKFLIFKP